MGNKWAWGGRSYAFDISRASNVRLLGEAVAELDGEISSDTAAECRSVDCISRFFDRIFGAGEGSNICRITPDAAYAYLDFILFINRQMRDYSCAAHILYPQEVVQIREERHY